MNHFEMFHRHFFLVAKVLGIILVHLSAATFLVVPCKMHTFSRSRSFDCSATLASPETIAGNLTILKWDKHYLVVDKPPSVVCHHSEWTGSRSRAEIPMLQRTREALSGQRVNLVHRLDRGASGCLLMAYNDNLSRKKESKNSTMALIEAMAQPNSTKTYVALVRGEGILNGRDMRQEGWFLVDRPIKDERGILNNASTWFHFVAGQDNNKGKIDRPRASLVLARPETGRWHQIRRHLNGLSHPILGDSSHGSSRENREWRERGMLPERTCLHLARMQLTGKKQTGESLSIDVQSPLAPDMVKLLRDHLPIVLEEALPVLEQEGILLKFPSKSQHEVLSYEVHL